MPTFNDPKEEGLEKHWEKEKMLVPAFSPFPTVFSTLSKREIIILATFNLSSLSIMLNPKFCHLGKD